MKKYSLSLSGSLALTGGMCLAICQWLIFHYAQIEAKMGMVQKIFYTHMPLAWWALVSFGVVFFSSIMYLRRKTPYWNLLAGSAAEVGLIFCTLALLTGSIWARHSWGAWWVWEPRLATTLIMWFVYAGYMIIRGLNMPDARKNAIAAVIGIAAFIDVPLVFFATRIWQAQSIHPPSIGLTHEMAMTIIASVIAMGIFWLGLLGFRNKSAKIRFKIEMLATSKILLA